MRILTVTGCKPMELSIFNEADPRIVFVKKALEKRLIGFIEEGLEWVLISGQTGVEMWTAEVVLELKEMYDIKVGIIPPFENQESRWPEALKHKYKELIFVADFCKPIFKGDYKGAYQFQAKDGWLVDKSDAALILMDEENPGSAGYFHDVAKEAEGYPIYMITPSDIEDMVEELRMTDPHYWD